MEPTVNEVHTDAVLTNISVNFLQADTAFMARRVFPVVPVEKRSDLYRRFNRNDFARDQMQRRPPATESAGSGYGMDTDTYSCDVWALHKDISNQERANSDAPLNPDRNAAQFLTQQAMIRLERQWAADYFATGIWDTEYAGVAANPTATQVIHWDDHTSSDPMADIRAARRNILVATGYQPNRLILGFDTFNALADHPDIVERVKYTSAEVVTEELLARLFRVDQVMVAEAIYATNAEGQAEAYAFIHGKHALLAYAAPTPGLELPSAGYTFVWRGISQGLGADVSVGRFRMEHLRADRVEIESAWDNKLVSDVLGVFFNGVVS